MPILHNKTPLREEGRNKTKASSGKKRLIAAAGHLISQTDRLPDLAPSPRALRRGAACSPVGPDATREVAEASSGRVPPPLSMSAALYSLFVFILPQAMRMSTCSVANWELSGGGAARFAARSTTRTLKIRGPILDSSRHGSSTQWGETPPLWILFPRPFEPREERSKRIIHREADSIRRASYLCPSGGGPYGFPAER